MCEFHNVSKHKQNLTDIFWNYINFDEHVSFLKKLNFNYSQNKNNIAVCLKLKVCVNWWIIYLYWTLLKN